MFGMQAIFAAGALLAAPLAAEELPAEIASYTLEAHLDAELHRVAATGTIRWTNRTANPTAELYFHLYLNGFANSSSSYLRDASEEAELLAEHGWGFIEVEELRDSAGHDLAASLEFVAREDGNAKDRTVARVRLPSPVLPGQTIELRTRFLSQLPYVVSRTGFKNDFHFVAQWFPKLGVFEPDGSWNCPQFRSTSEFFADFGSYDVTLTVPEGYAVGATGVQVEQSAGAGRVRARYRQGAVHDFAWTAWPGFVEKRQRFAAPDLPAVEMILLLRRETERFAPRYFAALTHALSRFGRWYGPYPYPTLTMVDPPWGAEAAGGMEYPTFIATGGRVLSPPLTWDPEGVTVHEFGHQFWYGLVASDEFHESYLDEGINTYSTARVMRAAYPPEAWSFRAFGVPLVFDSIRLDAPLDSAARYFRHTKDDPITRTAWGYSDGAYGALTYSKMALLMEQIERQLTPPVMERAMRAYATGFRYRHPRTADLVQTLSRESGRDLTPVFRQLLAGSGELDYAVAEATTARREGSVGIEGAGPARTVDSDAENLPGWESEVLVRRLGEVRLPVVVELSFADGRKERRTWDGEERWVRYHITGPKLVAAEVDPDEVLVLDVNRLNNSRRVAADRRAARRWGQSVRFWIQNLLETFAAFA